jgi:hypothetical protein
VAVKDSEMLRHTFGLLFLKVFPRDLCKKPIASEHQKLYMATITIEGYQYRHDDGGDDWKETYLG